MANRSVQFAGGDLVERVVADRVQDRQALGRAHSLGSQLVDVPLDELVHGHAHGLRAFHFCADNLGRRLIDDRAAVVGAVNVGVGAHAVGGGISGGDGIDLVGEGQLEAVRLGAHLVYLERHLAGPRDAVEREAPAATGAPAAVGAADEERAVGLHVGGDIAGAEAFQK